MILVASNRRVFALIGGTCQQGGQLGQTFVALKPFEIVKNCLLD